jgi:TonB family protein
MNMLTSRSIKHIAANVLLVMTTIVLNSPIREVYAAESVENQKPNDQPQVAPPLLNVWKSVLPDTSQIIGSNYVGKVVAKIQMRGEDQPLEIISISSIPKSTAHEDSVREALRHWNVNPSYKNCIPELSQLNTTFLFTIENGDQKVAVDFEKDERKSLGSGFAVGKRGELRAAALSKFPALARRKGISAVVMLELEVNSEDAKLVNARVVQISPQTEFDSAFEKAALEAIKSAEFIFSSRPTIPTTVKRCFSLNFRASK